MSQEKGTGKQENEKEQEQEQEEVIVLHIGNLLAITSDKYGYTEGHVIYRDLDLMRIRPLEASDRAVDFPLMGDGSTFAPELGVSNIELRISQTSDYYVDFLGARPGETLEFFTLDGAEAAPSGVVEEVFKTPSKDSIKLTDGRTLKFRMIGPQPPIAVIRVRSAETEEAAVAAVAVPVDEPQFIEVAHEGDIMELLGSVLPAATMEIIPSAERSYPDSMQREDMFQDLLAEISAKQRTNPRRIRFIEREVDLALALKNISLLTDSTGRVLGPAPYLLSTVKDVIAASKTALPAAIPIVAAARVLNLDDADPEERAFNENHIYPRYLDVVQLTSEERAAMYLEGTERKDFYDYTYDLLKRDQAVLRGDTPMEWREDQDVIRTAGLGVAVEGLSKDLPRRDDAGRKDDKTPVTLAYISSDVTDRAVRVLTADKSTNLKTGAVHIVAPSDPSKITGYVILPPKAAFALRPPKYSGDLPTALLYSATLESDNLPTIAETLRNLYSADVSPQNAWTLSADAAGETSVAEWLKSVLRYAVHPTDSQGPRTPRLLSMLDTLGLGLSDMSPEVADVIWDAVAESQTLWQNLLSEKRKEIQAALNDEAVRTYQSVTDTQGVAAPLWSALKLSEPLADLLEDIARRNPTLADAPTLMTASLLTEAQGDAAPLVWAEIAKLDSRELDGIDVASSVVSLADSRAYILRRKTLIAAPFLAMRAAPEINPCVHVKRLEAIRNVDDILQRSRLLRGFVEELQGPSSATSADWVTCILCKNTCVCYHELMELEALAQPARMDAIQKQILIRFGGERYEGKIVCKVCGQALQDIDYDDHVEFDDNGRPIVGASVLTDEQMEDTTESVWNKALAPSVTFGTQSQRDIGEALQLILERGGLVAQPDVIKQIVRYADLYVSQRAPPQAAYETQRTKMLASASTKIKTATGFGGATADVPTYAAILNQLSVSALVALLTIAIQSADPPIVVTNPFPLCTYSRDGYPFNPTSKPDESGALLYVACITASIVRDMPPWRSLTWSGLTTLDSRRKKILPVAMSALQIILGADTKSAPLSFTPEVRQALAKARTDVEGIKARSLVSLTDQLPAGFRPEPAPPKMDRPAIERDPMAALAAGNKSAGPVAAALKQQSIAIVGELHAEASKSIAIMIATGQKPGADAVCCPVSFSHVEELQGAPGKPRLLKAYEILRGANPVAVNAGTHLWPVYATPVPQPVEQSVGEEVFFKLFLKYCYRGPRVGESHEFSVGNICRQCGLALGKPLDLVDFGKEGSAILAAQQGSLRIEVTHAAFGALSEAVRHRRTMVAPVHATKAPWIAGLEAILDVAEKGPFATALGESLAQVAAVKPGEATDEMGRAMLWLPMATLMDNLRDEVGDRIGPLVAKVAGKASQARAREATTAMSVFDALTEDPFIEGPRAVQEYWCAKVQAAGAGYGVTTTKGATWDKLLSHKHKDLLVKLITSNSQWFGGVVRDELFPVLSAFARSVGPLVNVWIQKVRPSPSASSASSLWTVTEAQLVLRTIVLQGWRDAVTTTSQMYATISSGAVRESVAAAIADWTRALMFHAKQQFVKYSKDTIKRILQDRAGLERDTIVEEFESIKDDDLRAAELIKKQFRIGRWAGGANLQKYDADTFEFENEQRKRMGIMDPPVEQVILEGVTQAPQDFGLGAVAAPEEGYDVGQGADGDDY